MRPLRNHSPPKHVIWRKDGVDRCKNVVSMGGQEKYKNKNIKKKPYLTFTFHRYAGPALKPIFTIFGTWCGMADLITHVKY